MRSHPRTAFLLQILTAVALVIAGGGCAQSTRTLRADLSYIVQCDGRPTAQTEKTVEQFLNAEGFKSLNLGRIQKDHGVGLYDLHILGLQGQQKTVDFLALPQQIGRYAVGLYTKPPTVRAESLEKSLEVFLTKDLGCRIAQTTRGENPAEAIDFFNREVARIEGLFKQADELKNKRGK
jgi:hypothetical protein